MPCWARTIQAWSDDISIGLRSYADALRVTRKEGKTVYLALNDRTLLEVARFAAHVLPKMQQQSGAVELALDPSVPAAVDPALVTLVSGWKVVVERAADQTFTTKHIPRSVWERLRTCAIEDVMEDCIQVHLRGDVDRAIGEAFLRVLGDVLAGDIARAGRGAGSGSWEPRMQRVWKLTL